MTRARDLSSILAADGSLNISTSVNLADNEKAYFGTSNDLQIYHDGSNSYIVDDGTGNLYFKTANGASIRLLSGATNKAMFVANSDSSVDLYHNNALKLATTATGVDVTGVITTDGLTTSADITFGDNDKAVFGAGSDLQIYSNAGESYILEGGTGNLNIRANSLYLENAAGDNYLAGVNGGGTYIYYNGSQKLETTLTGLNVSGDLNLVGRGTSYSLRSPDWRVYTDTNNAFVWDDYSQTRMSLNSAGHLTIDGDVRTEGQVRATGWAGSTSTNALGMGVEIGVSGGIGFMLVYDRNNSTYGNFIANVNTSASIDPTAGGGAIVMNDGGFNTDFRVESDTKPYALFVHGNSGVIGVDNDTPSLFNTLGNSSHLVIGDGSATAGVTCFSNPGNGYGNIAFADSSASGGSAQYAGLIQYGHPNNTMSFYVNANFHTVMQDGFVTSRQTGNGHETVQYIRSSSTYTHVKTNIYRNSIMYYILVVGAGGYAGENTLSLLTGYAYASNRGSTNSSYHGITNLGNYAISDVYYTPDDYLCFTINSNYYGQYTVTMSSHATSYNSTAPNLITAYTWNTSTARYYA